MMMRYTSSRNVLMPPIAIVWLVAGCMACWFAGYEFSIGYPVYEDMGATPLWNAVCLALSRRELIYGFGFLLTLAGAFLVYRANYMLSFIHEKTLLPFWIYLLLECTNPDLFPIKASGVGVICLVLVIYQLFVSYHNPEARDRAFNVGWIVGLGSLLWVYLLCFLPLFWIGMYKFRSLSWRTFLATLIGVAAVYWLVLAWCVWAGDYGLLLVPLQLLSAVRFFSFESASWLYWLGIGYTILLTVVASMNIFSHEHDDNLRSRQYLSFLMLIGLWSLLLFFLYEPSEEFLAVMWAPASVLIAHLFAVVKKRYMIWIYHLSVVFYYLIFAIRVWNF